MALLLILTACGTSTTSPTSPEAPSDKGEKLRVVATTTIVGDVVRQIGGDAIELTVLLPAGTDPHGFEPTPRDIAQVSQADVIFINGLGLERFLESLLANARGDASVVSVSEGVEPRQLATEGAAASNEDQSQDPHVWMSPHNVMVWSRNIARALSDLDPNHAEIYLANDRQYRHELETLDAWIREQVGQIPAERRVLVTDHAIFGYFADRYGFTQVGTIVPGYSTLAAPSAQDLARLESAIRGVGARAIFVGNTINPSLAQRVTEDTGTQLVFVYTGSLSERGGPADNYLHFMRYNVNAIVGALK